MRLLLLGCIFLSALSCFAVSDSLSKNKVDSTLFNSDFELDVFSRFMLDSASSDPLMLLMAVNTQATDEPERVQKTIAALVTSLREKTAKQKQPAKAYKIIFDDVHTAFLKKYSLVADFREIFLNGTYNCVSASALYSIVLKQLGIHHVIRETVDHVYVIADPDNLHFILETTDPQGGYFEIDEQFKKNYIEFLLKQKLITQAELNSLSSEQVFTKYFYEDKPIDIFQLAGLQYYNTGVDALTKSNRAEALKAFEKAYLLYPSDRVLYFINYCLGTEVDERQGYDRHALHALIKLLNYNDSDFLKKQAVQFFQYACEDVLIKKNDTSEFEALYSQFISGVENDSVKTEASALYYYYKGTALYYQSYFREALPLLKQAFHLQPSNIRLQAVIAECVLRMASAWNSPDKILNILDEQVANFDFLKNYKLVQSTYARMYLGLAGNYFQMNDKKNGLLYLSKFISYHAEVPDIAVENDVVGHAYGEASSYYVRQGEYTKARTYLEDGLKLSPFSEVLNRKLQVLKDYR